MTGLRLGVIAFLDILGFKGIWTREQPRVVLEAMRRIKRRGRQLQGRDRSGSIVVADGFDHRVKCVSDTVIVVVAPRGRGCTERMMYRAMYSAAWIAGSIMNDALSGPVPLLFRGCLGVGLMKMAGDFLIGPAVDETASQFERADGPFFWLTPSALALSNEYADTFTERIEPALMTRYQVPLNSKHSEGVDTLVHSYFGVRCPPEYWSELEAQIAAAFGPRPLCEAVDRKYSNTVSFLRHIKMVARDTEYREPDLRMPYWDDLTSDQRLGVAYDGGVSVVKEFLRRTRTVKLFG